MPIRGEVKIPGTKITFRKILGIKVHDVPSTSSVPYLKDATIVNYPEVVRYLLPKTLAYVPEIATTIRANLDTYAIPIDVQYLQRGTGRYCTGFFMIFATLPVPYPRKVEICAKVLIGVRVWERDGRLLAPSMVATHYACNVISGHISKKLRQIAKNVLKYVREGPRCKCIFRIELPDECVREVLTYVRTYVCKCGCVCLGTYDLLTHIYSFHNGSLRNVTVEDKIKNLSRALDLARTYKLPDWVILKLESKIKKLEEKQP